MNLRVDRIEVFCRRWKVRELALFGSVLREDFRPDSDVDVRRESFWRVATVRIPELIELLEKLVPPLP